MNIGVVTNWVRASSDNISVNLSPGLLSIPNTSVDQSRRHLAFGKLKSPVKIKVFTAKNDSSSELKNKIYLFTLNFLRTFNQDINVYLALLTIFFKNDSSCI